MGVEFHKGIDTRRERSGRPEKDRGHNANYRQSRAYNPAPRARLHLSHTRFDHRKTRFHFAFKARYIGLCGEIGSLLPANLASASLNNSGGDRVRMLAGKAAFFCKPLADFQSIQSDFVCHIFYIIPQTRRDNRRKQIIKSATL